MSDDKGINELGADSISTINRLLEHQYFQLAIEKEVRMRTNAYLKVVVSVLSVALAVIASIAGVQVSSLLKDAKQNYETRAAELKSSSDNLRQRLESMNKDVVDEEKNRVTAMSRSVEVELREGELVNKMSGQVALAKEANDKTKTALMATESAHSQALEAAAKAQALIKDAQDAASNASQANQRLLNLESSANNTLQQVNADRKSLTQLTDTDTQILFSSETARVLIQGHGVKNPCVELKNLVYWDNSAGKIRPYDMSSGLSTSQSNSRAVRFSLLHIHLARPLTLRVQLYSDCGTSTPISEYKYAITNKFDYLTWHPLRGTPFSFRLAQVFYPMLSYTFVDVELKPDLNLLKCQAEEPTITDDRLCPYLSRDTTLREIASR